MAMGYLYRVTRKINGVSRPVSKVWHACWSDAAGRRQQETTGHVDRAEANKFLRKRMTAVDNDEAVTAKTGKITVSAALAAVIDDKKLNGCRWITEPERMIAGHIVPGLGGRRKLASVGVLELRAYSAKRVAEGAANATVNRELALLRRAFKLAHRAKSVSSVPEIEFLAEAPPRSGFVDRGSFDKIVALLPSWLRPAVTTMYVLGWRKSEVLGLTPDQVDLKAGTVTLTPEQTKTAEPRVVPLPEELRKVMKKQLASVAKLKKQGTPTRWLFHRPRGAAIGSFKKRWRTACTRAGHPTLLVHDLRRSAARNLTRAGVPEQTAMRFLGHKSNSTFRRYRILDERDMINAAAQLDTFFAQSKAKPKKKSARVRKFPTQQQRAAAR
jgi:integrase